MFNRPCISCKKPMNGGVYRKPNECPHCSVLQDTGAVASTHKKAPVENINTIAKQQVEQSKPVQTSRVAARAAVQKPQLSKSKSAPRMASKSSSDTSKDEELAAALAAHRASIAAKRKQNAARSSDGVQAQSARNKAEAKVLQPQT